MHRTRHLVLGVVVAAGISACSATSSADPTSAPTSAGGSYPVTVDDCGTEVEITAQPQRVMTVGTAAIATMDAAGAADRIGYRSGEFGAELPGELEHPPTDATVVDDADPETEAILSTDADAVYGYGLFKAKPDALTDQGIPLLTVLGECGHDAGDTGSGVGFETVAKDITRLGTVFGTSGTADPAAEELLDEVSHQEDRAPGSSGDAAWVYYFGSTDPLSAYGSGGMAQDVLDKAGLRNVFEKETKTYIETTPEALLEENPRWIVLTYGLYGEDKETLKEKFLSEPGTKELDAVAADRVVMVSAGASEPSPRALDGLVTIVDALTDTR